MHIAFQKCPPQDEETQTGTFNMAIDKGIYQAPQGISEQEGPEIEIELVDDSGFIGDTADGIEHEDEGSDKFNENLAEHMDSGVLDGIASDLIGLFDADVAARKDWADTYVEGLKLLGLKYEETTEPWAGACGEIGRAHV